MSLQDFLGMTPNIIIIDFLSENSDRDYNKKEISEYTGLSMTILEDKLPELIINKIIEIVDDNVEIKRFRLKDNDIVNYLIRSVLAHSFTMAEEETSEQEQYEQLYNKI